MMEPIIDNIQITVKDMSVALPSYNKFLPLLGFDIQNKVGAVIDKHESMSSTTRDWPSPSPRQEVLSRPTRLIDGNREPSIILPSGRPRAPKSTRLHAALKEIGATIVSPPREYPEYTPPGYYALFFKDLEGVNYEIVCTNQPESGRNDWSISFDSKTPLRPFPKSSLV